MMINGKNLDIDSFLEISDKSLLKKIKNNIYLSDEDILVLKKYNINYNNYSYVEDLIFDIEEILNDDYYDDLEELSKKLAECKYYNYTDK